MSLDALEFLRPQKRINQIAHNKERHDYTDKILQFHDVPSYRRSQPRTYRHAIIKKTTVITINIKSAIRLLLKTDSYAKIASQAQCQPFDCEILSFKGMQPLGWLQVARTKHRTVASCKDAIHLSTRSPYQEKTPKASVYLLNLRMQHSISMALGRVEMKLLRLAHVVLYSDSYMGHESSASKYRPVSQYRHRHRGRVYTGLTVTRSSADVTVTVLVKDDHDFFAFVFRLTVFAFSCPVLLIRLEPNKKKCLVAR